MFICLHVATEVINGCTTKSTREDENEFKEPERGEPQDHRPRRRPRERERQHDAEERDEERRRHAP